MTNPLKGEVELVADGVSYTLVMTSNAIVQVEQLFGGKAIGEVIEDLASVQVQRALLWAALQEHHGEIDLLKAGRLADDYEPGLQDLSDKLARVLRFRLSRTPLEKPW